MLAHKLLLAKEASGKTFNQIAKECGLTNLYTAQLFFNQVTRRAWGAVVAGLPSCCSCRVSLPARRPS